MLNNKIELYTSIVTLEKTILKHDLLTLFYLLLRTVLVAVTTCRNDCRLYHVKLSVHGDSETSRVQLACTRKSRFERHVGGKHPSRPTVTKTLCEGPRETNVSYPYGYVAWRVCAYVRLPWSRRVKRSVR